MSILVMKGNLRNLTGATLKLIGGDGGELLSLPSEGRVIVEWADEYLGSFNGCFDLGFRVATSMNGFPPVLNGTYYVVNGEVVLAAMHLKKPIQHLLLPIGQFYHKQPHQTRLVGYQRLMPAEYWLDAAMTKRVKNAF